MMFYVFESTDRYGSRKRVVYGHLKSALRHAWLCKKLPKIQRNANKVW